MANHPKKLPVCWQRQQERQSKRQSPPEAHVGRRCAFGVEFDLEDRETDYSPRSLVVQVVLWSGTSYRKTRRRAPLVLWCVNFPEKNFLICFPFEKRDMSTHWADFSIFSRAIVFCFCWVFWLCVWWFGDTMEKIGGNPILNHVLFLVLCYWTHCLVTAETKLSLNSGELNFH